MNVLETLPLKDYDIYQIPIHKTDLTREVKRGLSLPQKRIDPKFFYDDIGCELYEQITRTDDYYPTSTENEILRANALPIAAVAGKHIVLIEPGAGSCRKVEYLIEALRPDVYMPIDVSATTLDKACERLTAKYILLDCIAVTADFHHIDDISELLPNRRRIIFFPGSTIGNMEPEIAVKFLAKLRKLIGHDGGILVGVDTVKDESVLSRAYNDREGITAKFNRNILNSLNDAVGTDFDINNFEHEAFFNARESRIEMHLRSKYDQVVSLDGAPIYIASGETIHTENSYKYTASSFRAVANKADLECTHIWTDSRNYFALYYLQPMQSLLQ